MNQMPTVVTTIFVLSSIVWALVQILTKEAPPTPNRGQSLGPRPGGLPPAPRPPVREPAPRWTPPVAQPASAGSRLANASDDVIILSAETLRTPLPVTPRPAGAAARARPARKTKPTTPAAPGRPEPARKLLGGGVTQSLSQTLEKPGPLLPMAIGMSPLSIAPETVRAPETTSPTPTSTLDVRAALMSPSRLREAFVLNELLKPPVALRSRRL
jgi:hypothetical protein